MSRLHTGSSSRLVSRIQRAAGGQTPKHGPGWPVSRPMPMATTDYDDLEDHNDHDYASAPPSL